MIRIVTWSVGEEDYFFKMPDGRIERVSGLLRFACLAFWLVVRGYTLREEGSK